MVENFDALDSVNGCQAIPFMQVILMLTADLDGSLEVDRNIMTKMLNALVEKLEMNPPSKAAQLSARTAKSEVQLIILRLVGIMMGKIKSTSSSSKAASVSIGGGLVSAPMASGSLSAAVIDNIQFVAASTANALLRNGSIIYCLNLLESFLPYWKQNSSNAESTLTSPSGAMGPIITTASGTPANNTLLKPTQYGPSPDMQPFFARQYVKGLNDVFELYPSVLTEMAVRLPYQILKLSSSSAQNQQLYDSAHMTFTLCEYMQYMQSPVLRRQVRKLLLYMCGNKERYRQLRDLHSLNTHMKAIKQCCGPTSVSANTTPLGPQQIQIQSNTSSTSAVLSYNSLVSLVEHLRACYEIAQARTGNWQRFCLLHTDILASLLSVSCHQLDESISSIILQLLQAAVICINPIADAASAKVSGQSLRNRGDRDKSEEMDNTESKFDPANCNLLVQQIFNQVKFLLVFKSL